jgi:hypothetical protein
MEAETCFFITNHAPGVKAGGVFQACIRGLESPSWPAESGKEAGAIMA